MKSPKPTMKSPKPKSGFSMSLSKTKPSNVKGYRSDLSNTRRSAIGDVPGEEDDASAAPVKDYVTGVGGGKVVTRELVVERGPRVIALATNPWERAAAEAAAAAEKMKASAAALADGVAAPPSPSKQEEKSIDQMAAEAIAREYSGSGPSGSTGGAGERAGLGLDSDRVISMSSKSGGTSIAAGEGGGGGSGGGQGGGDGEQNILNGILAQNRIPGLAEIDGENEKFKHDLGHRAEDMSFRSKAYVDVPVNEFGAALLRGMGWAGPEGGAAAEEGSIKDVEPRHHRLGLGAQPKPPEEVRVRCRRSFRRYILP